MGGRLWIEIESAHFWLNKSHEQNGFLSIAEASRKSGVNPGRIRTLLIRGFIQGWQDTTGRWSIAEQEIGRLAQVIEYLTNLSVISAIYPQAYYSILQASRLLGVKNSLVIVWAGEGIAAAESRIENNKEVICLSGSEIIRLREARITDGSREIEEASQGPGPNYISAGEFSHQESVDVSLVRAAYVKGDLEGREQGRALWISKDSAKKWLTEYKARNLVSINYIAECSGLPLSEVKKLVAYGGVFYPVLGAMSTAQQQWLLDVLASLAEIRPQGRAYADWNYTVQQAAILVGVKSSTLNLWIKKGLLPAVRLQGKRWIIAGSEIIRILQEDKQYITLAEAAIILGIPETAVLGLTIQGAISRTVRNGRTLVLITDEIRRRDFSHLIPAMVITGDLGAVSLAVSAYELRNSLRCWSGRQDDIGESLSLTENLLEFLWAVRMLPNVNLLADRLGTSIRQINVQVSRLCSALGISGNNASHRWNSLLTSLQDQVYSELEPLDFLLVRRQREVIRRIMQVDLPIIENVAQAAGRSKQKLLKTVGDIGSVLDLTGENLEVWNIVIGLVRWPIIMSEEILPEDGSLSARRQVREAIRAYIAAFDLSREVSGFEDEAMVVFFRLLLPAEEVDDIRRQVVDFIGYSKYQRRRQEELQRAREEKERKKTVKQPPVFRLSQEERRRLRREAREASWNGVKSLLAEKAGEDWPLIAADVQKVLDPFMEVMTSVDIRRITANAEIFAACLKMLTEELFKFEDVRGLRGHVVEIVLQYLDTVHVVNISENPEVLIGQSYYFGGQALGLPKPLLGEVQAVRMRVGNKHAVMIIWRNLPEEQINPWAPGCLVICCNSDGQLYIQGRPEDINYLYDSDAREVQEFIGSRVVCESFNQHGRGVFDKYRIRLLPQGWAMGNIARVYVEEMACGKERSIRLMCWDNPDPENRKLLVMLRFRRDIGRNYPEVYLVNEDGIEELLADDPTHELVLYDCLPELRAHLSFLKLIKAADSAAQIIARERIIFRFVEGEYVFELTAPFALQRLIVMRRLEAGEWIPLGVVRFLRRGEELPAGIVLDGRVLERCEKVLEDSVYIIKGGRFSVLTVLAILNGASIYEQGLILLGEAVHWQDVSMLSKGFATQASIRYVPAETEVVVFEDGIEYISLGSLAELKGKMRTLHWSQRLGSAKQDE
ncbi:MAG: helix-turn-helix domain-containing protein, partial [Candidatus Omnitrophica bacterium]|nr:helix-turn-helix domain-containing protein [Candidatus Omnitrophota bacterium]